MICQPLCGKQESIEDRWNQIRIQAKILHDFKSRQGLKQHGLLNQIKGPPLSILARVIRNHAESWLDSLIPAIPHLYVLVRQN